MDNSAIVHIGSVTWVQFVGILLNDNVNRCRKGELKIVEDARQHCHIYIYIYLTHKPSLVFSG